MNVEVTVNQSAFADYVKHFVVNLRTAAATALGRDVNVNATQSSGEWILTLTSGNVNIIVPIAGAIPVIRQNQMGQVTNTATEMQEKLLQGIIKRAANELWPLYVKRIVKIDAR